MILIVNICKENLHYLEFVKPVGDILKINKIKFKTKHYKNINEDDIKNADKIIICGTSLADNKFMEDIKKFNWIKFYNKPILGICGGAHIIGLVLGYKLKKKKEIGLKEIEIKEEFLGIKGKRQVYHLHQFYVLPEIFKHEIRPIYAVLFHPEVRNKELILKFSK